MSCLLANDTAITRIMTMRLCVCVCVFVCMCVCARERQEAGVELKDLPITFSEF